ncbi:mitochondrial 37S ribosomal protein uS14m [Magnusiomyces paraingens]|uniref:37S ribosomal protein MRP2, mitochondrial n=1 Tax=Magnusiomyces paraingens TaxID=2606893 RepID=A0A5E8BH75_9ASCO|nr:uncharacterized protein SAPINGB_P002952 [Saprochaete ingens]VVT51004.1 unnamed protein product [Saprochaete ingens]
MPPRFPGFTRAHVPGGEWVKTRMVRDNFKRAKVAEEEVTRTSLRYISRNTTLPMRTRIEAQLQLVSMPNYTRTTQIKNRCVDSGYARSVIKEFRLCRMKFREKALAGELPGVKKASW